MLNSGGSFQNQSHFSSQSYSILNKIFSISELTTFTLRTKTKKGFQKRYINNNYETKIFCLRCIEKSVQLRHLGLIVNKHLQIRFIQEVKELYKINLLKNGLERARVCYKLRKVSSLCQNPQRGFKLRKMICNYIIYKLQKKMASSSYQFQHLSSTSERRPYHRIGQDEKNNLIYEVFQNKLSISKASRKLGINNSTAKVVIRKYKQNLKKKQKQEKITNVQENECTSIQQQLKKSTSNQIQTPIFFIMASPAYFNLGSNYPFSVAPPFISYFHNVE